MSFNMKWRTSHLIIAVILLTNCKTIDGIGLDCTYQMREFLVIGSVYTCQARVLFTGIDGNESVTAVFGIHETGKGYEDVRGLRIEAQNLELFPTNIEYFFPHTIAITFYITGITVINHRHLIPFPNLQYLNLNQNKITSIDGDLLFGIDKLQYINFSSNDIRHVGHDLNLPTSGGVDFRSNACINEIATTTTAIAGLKLNLLRNCPPTISQIENSLEQRQNLLTQIDGQVQNLIEQNVEINNELETLRNEQVHLIDRIAYLERIIGNKIEARPEDHLLIDAARTKND